MFPILIKYVFYVSFTFMIVLFLKPIVEEGPPQTIEESGTLASWHEGGVIAWCVLTPHVMTTYALSISFIVLYYN